MADRPRPAFYALAAGSWRDYLTLLHPPYTAWHLSYVAIGAALAPELDRTRLAASLVAFFLAVGVAAHWFDELRGRPLRTSIPERVLAGGAAVALVGAVAIGGYGVVEVGPGFGLFVATGALLVPAYNLEWFGGRLHGDQAFALAWGAFPVLASYFAQTGELAGPAFAAAVAAYAFSLAQRRLSNAARRARRVEGVTDDRAEGALRALSVALPILALAVILTRR